MTNNTSVLSNPDFEIDINLDICSFLGNSFLIQNLLRATNLRALDMTHLRLAV